ncbi:MAG: hypothetical protein II150_06370 [Thermoguttaceae bacterium]|nr:hypothetical protein [Thermoguttaceae bacterium]
MESAKNQNLGKNLIGAALASLEISRKTATVGAANQLQNTASPAPIRRGHIKGPSGQS